MKQEHEIVGRTEKQSCAEILCRAVVPLVALAGLSILGAVSHAGMIVNVTIQEQNSRGTSTSARGGRLDESISFSGAPRSPAGTNVGMFEAGALDLKLNDATSTQFMGREATSSSNGILSFCIEMTERLQSGPTNLTVIPLTAHPAQVSGPNVGSTGATSAMLFGELWGKYSSNAFSPPAGLTTSQAAGAFQLAVRKLENDGKDPFGMPGGVNLGSGYVEATARNASDAPVLSTTSNWINSRSLDPAPGDLAKIGAVSGPKRQDPVGQFNQSESVPPESSSNLIWFVVAAAGVYAIMRRGSNAA